jgi:hypothetical protein
MRGSVLVTFDEFVNDLGIDYIDLTYGQFTRCTQYTDINNLYGTYINTGDVMQVAVYFTGAGSATISITRKDFTTDDVAGDRGIKTTLISTTQTNISGETVQFTASTRPDAYGYQYIIDISTDYAAGALMTEASNKILTENSYYINTEQ